MSTTDEITVPDSFTYSEWRHGGWYVHGVRYPSGAIGCVSRNYADRKWRIACDPRPFEEQPTFRTRDEAAAAEYRLAAEQTVEARALIEDAFARLGDTPEFYAETIDYLPNLVSDVCGGDGAAVLARRVEARAARSA